MALFAGGTCSRFGPTSACGGTSLSSSFQSFGACGGFRSSLPGGLFFWVVAATAPKVHPLGRLVFLRLCHLGIFMAALPLAARLRCVRCVCACHLIFPTTGRLTAPHRALSPPRHAPNALAPLLLALVATLHPLACAADSGLAVAMALLPHPLQHGALRSNAEAVGCRGDAGGGWPPRASADAVSQRHFLVFRESPHGPCTGPSCNVRRSRVRPSCERAGVVWLLPRAHRHPFFPSSPGSPGLWQSWTQQGTTNPNFFFALTLAIVAAKVGRPVAVQSSLVRGCASVPNPPSPSPPSPQAALVGDMAWVERLAAAQAKHGPGTYALIKR